MPRRPTRPTVRDVPPLVSRLTPEDNHAAVCAALKSAARGPQKAREGLTEVFAMLGLDLPVALDYGRLRGRTGAGQ